jgi:signal transduction histidine kinase
VRPDQSEVGVHGRGASPAGLRDRRVEANERRDTFAAPRSRRGPGIDPVAVERLIGAGSSKPGVYATWRDHYARRDCTTAALERISSALCAAPARPIAVCDAAVETAARLFEARLAARRPVLAEHDEGLECSTLSGTLVTAPVPVNGDPVGILAVGLPNGIEVAQGDMSILVTLANHAGIALHNSSLCRGNERRAAELERRGVELERRGLELRGTPRRLEEAGRRQLLSQKRNWIGRQLHDSVAQQLLTIGKTQPVVRRHAARTGPGRARGAIQRGPSRRGAACMVTLGWQPQLVSLAVADDGSGNHRELQQSLFISASKGDHFGLTGIAERVRGLGGAVWFERRHGGGVRLRVELPVPMSASVSHGKVRRPHHVTRRTETADTVWDHGSLA